MTDIRRVTDSFAVAGQIDLADIADLKAQGFTAIISNRPDEEAPSGAKAADVRKAAESAGLTYVHAPFVGQPTPEAIEAAAKASGKTLAYCRSGTRSVTAWAMGQAKTGALTAEQIIGSAEEAGYHLAPLKDVLHRMGAR
jgi:uncharacterized protein (TIGR01244 family)